MFSGKILPILCAAAVCGALPATGGVSFEGTSGSSVPDPPPGAMAYPAELAARLWAAYEAKGPGYEPRSEHRRPDGSPVYLNRLILEDSPYLIQHAHNPVNWYPWGPEAFETARLADKPIFLSIGYSTCHWCHVMEEESFDDEEVARLLNERFVAIKVDREQRPDVDDVYMTAVQLFAGRGGWPMSSFLTGEGKPFFGGTYYPKATFLDLLGQVSAAWRDRRPELVTQADNVSAAVNRVTSAAGEAAQVDENVIAAAVEGSLARHDNTLGGFSPAPKFPHEPELLFLLDRVLREDDAKALAAVEISLDNMARGGIYDQIGGGFHRYSTDAVWLVPHFEKMLYNQAHLARAYLEAWRLTGNPFFERIARQTLDYVLRDLTSPAGAFFSATDADSEGREGEFFVWTPVEVRAALAPGDAELAIQLFGMSDEGNFEGKNILFLPTPLSEVAEASKLPLEQLTARLDRIRERLYQVREERIHPIRDDKIVTAWNAMMITTLARAGEDLEESRYSEAARTAADFLWRSNRRDDGRLWRAHLEGSSSVEATLNDYAYLLEALVTLYDVTTETGWLERSRSVADVMIARFWDDAAGGFFLGEDDHGGRLPVRPKSPTDGAIPSGNSVAVRALAMLAERTGVIAFEQKAQAALAAFSGLVRRQPTAFAYMLLAAEQLRNGYAGALGYAARGAVRARASLGRVEESTHPLTIELSFAEGWHVNSDRPLQDTLVPTRLSIESLAPGGGDNGVGWKLVEVRYPEPLRITLGFQAEPLAVFAGSAVIRAELTATRPERPRVARLRLTVQACDDQRCLRPEDLLLEVPAPGPLRGVGPAG